jgi:hypothetical protein
MYIFGHMDELWRAKLGLNFLVRPIRSSSNETSTLLPLDTASHADILVQDELPDNVDPAVVARQILVKLLCHLPHGGQTSPWDGGKVVVLVVQTDVVGEPVQWAVVGEGLRDGDVVLGVALLGSDALVDVVLGDEVACERVQATGEEAGQEEIENWLDRRAREEVEGQVEGKLHNDVEVVDPGVLNSVDGHGANGVEEDLEGAEESLAKDRVEKHGLKRGGKIGIEAIDAERLVVS